MRTSLVRHHCRTAAPSADVEITTNVMTRPLRLGSKVLPPVSAASLSGIRRQRCTKDPCPLGLGEALEHQVRETALVKQHSEMGEGLMPWVIGLFVVCVGLLVILRRVPLRRSDAPGTPHFSSAIPHQRLLIVRIVLGLIAVALAAGTIVQTVGLGTAAPRPPGRPLAQSLRPLPALSTDADAPTQEKRSNVRVTAHR